MTKNLHNSLQKIDRRVVLGVTTGILAASNINAATRSQWPLVVSTWPFGKPANDEALAVLNSGGSTLDAVEAGIRNAESGGLSSVGLSGNPNAAGFVQQDACIMHGPGHLAGSVAGIEGIPHPISAARKVMEKSPHVLLVGQGARDFAISNGCESENIDHHAAKLKEWQSKRNAKVEKSRDNHDTIALLVLGKDGTISGGCSTSGLGGKLPGRVGDSPILGSGLYVDNEVGAAGATGIGENVMRYCATFLIVEFMRQGLDPTSACRKVIARIASMDQNPKKLHINFVALDKHGRFGAAGTDDFPHSVTTPEFSQVLRAKAFNP